MWLFLIYKKIYDSLQQYVCELKRISLLIKLICRAKLYHCVLIFVQSPNITEWCSIHVHGKILPSSVTLWDVTICCNILDMLRYDLHFPNCQIDHVAGRVKGTTWLSGQKGLSGWLCSFNFSCTFEYNK